MTNYDDDYTGRIPVRRVVGSIHGFDKITTNTSDGTIPIADHGYTLPDLLALLRTLKAKFDPLRIAEIEALVRKHINDPNNPHQTDLDKIGTSVEQELYKLWLAEGNTGSRETFLKILFQYVEIADIPTTLEGTSYNKVTSCKGVATLLDNHNNSVDAHDALIRTLFPGGTVESVPTYGLFAYLGLDDTAFVSRKSSLWILNKQGTISEVKEDTLVADYSIGEAAFPIFGELTNLLSESESIDLIDYYFQANCAVERSKKIAHLKDKNTFSLKIRESNNLNIIYPEGFGFEGWDKAHPFDTFPFSSLEPPKEGEEIPDDVIATNGSSYHGLIYHPDDVHVVKDQYYTFSCFVKADGRYACGLAIQEEKVTGPYGFAQFDIKEGRVFTNDSQTNIKAYIYKLYGGWFRIQMTFKALASLTIHPMIYSLDIYDGDAIHSGLEGAGISLFGCQLTQSASISPYIPSRQGNYGVLAPTVVTVPIKDWYKETTGTLIVTASLAKDVSYMNGKTIYAIADSNRASFVGRYPVSNQNRAYLSSYDQDGYGLVNVWTPATTDTWLTMIHTYDSFSHLISGNSGGVTEATVGSTPYAGSDTLYIGCDRLGKNQLDGYIKSIVYYPNKTSLKNIYFFRMSEE